MRRFRFQLTFLTLALLVPAAFRAWLWIGRRGDLTDLGVGGTLLMFFTGLRMDGVTASGLTAITCLALVVAPKRALRGTLLASRVWAALVFLVISFAGFAGLQFFSFYDFQPNYLVLDHVGDTEVMRTIAAAYPILGVSAATLALATLLFWLLAKAAPLRARDGRDGRDGRSAGRDRLATFGLLLLSALLARGSLGHRPLNPSAAAFSSNRLANEVAGSGLYNVVYEAMQRQKGSYGAVRDCLQTLSEREAMAAAREHLAPTGAFVDDGPNPLVRRVEREAASHPKNVIFVVLESFTGRLIGHLDGELPLSPNLDRLAEQGMALDHCYATGERTIQGLEASLCSFPPLPGVAVIRRPEARAGFDTLATVLGRSGFATSFVYGGQGIFDQMKGFFLGNGYDRFVEEEDFEAPQFVGSWGVCDDDLYDRVILEARELHDAGRPFCVSALTVSLHSPWEYPEGRIEDLPRDVPVPKGFEYEELNTFLYADAAIGRLIERARAEPWFDDTMFVFVGDHGVHLRGKMSVPVEEYRVPAVFYCPKHIPPQRVRSVASQLDLSPTVLGLLGGSHRSTFYGRDVLKRSPEDTEGFALMIYRKSRYGVVSGDRLSILSPDGVDETRVRVDERWESTPSTVDHAADVRAAKATLQTAEILMESATYRARADFGS